jgi:hypothetical protein
MERLDLRDLPAFPPWLVELARKREAGSWDGEPFDTARALQGFPEGQRDSGLFALAGKFRQANLPYDVAEPLMREAAANCSPPFPADEAMAKLRGAYERYPAGPSKGKGTHARGPVTR